MSDETDKESQDPDRLPAIELSSTDQVRFVDMLLNPPSLSPAMLRALEAHKALIESDAQESSE